MKTLRLDLDGKYGLSDFLKRLWIIKYLGLRVNKVQVHDTVNGFHLRLVCDNAIDPIKAILFQALLGSDYRREMCNLLKIERGSKNWNILFKEKWATDKLGNEYQVSRETYNKELSHKVLRAIQLGE